MVQVIDAPESFGTIFGRGLGMGAGKGFSDAMAIKESRKARHQEDEALKRLGIDLSGTTDPKIRQEVVSQMLQGQTKDASLSQKMNLINQLRSQRNIEDLQGSSPSSSSISDDEILAISQIDPTLGNILQKQKKEDQRIKESERSYHSGYSKEAEKTVSILRESIPRKEMSLDLARLAVESGEIGEFSKDRLANLIGGPIGDALRTAKGAQLATAAKENLLSNMSRASARAQNLWFEQRLSSMFPQIGQSKEANLTIQEMLEGELAMDNAYLKEFDRLSEEDELRYGFVRKDIEKRARDAVKSENKQILARTSYRLKEIEENSVDSNKLKNQVGKKVIKGTPLTKKMAKLYLDKFGEDALNMAEKNGYYVPSIEEFELYQYSPSEFRER